MKTQPQIVPFQSRRDQLLVQAMERLFYALILVRCEPTKNSLGIACAMTKDAAGILDACWHFPDEPHPRPSPIDLEELDRIVQEDVRAARPDHPWPLE